MPIVVRSALVPYTAAQMYEVVNSVEDYPAFVPWCTSSASELLSPFHKRATLFFARGGLKTSFTTKNKLKPDKRIELDLVDGPFRHLHGVWKFTNIDDCGSKVELRIDFEISNRVIKVALESFFSQICDRLVNSFVQRATEVYG